VTLDVVAAFYRTRLLDMIGVDPELPEDVRAA
jgi:hypothetical protein